MFVWDWGFSWDVRLSVVKPGKSQANRDILFTLTCPICHPSPLSDELKLAKINNLCSVSKQQRRDPGIPIKSVGLQRSYTSNAHTTHPGPVCSPKSSSCVKVLLIRLKANCFFAWWIDWLLKNKRGKEMGPSKCGPAPIACLPAHWLNCPDFRPFPSVIFKYKQT